jgi:O-antigen/teichoic acid export membrane protein
VTEQRGSASAPSYARSAALLTAALATAGALTYAFFAIASHLLDRDDYGRVVVLWSAMFISISVLFRPIEQLLSRTIAELVAQGRPTRPALRVAARIQIVAAIAFVLAAIAARGPLESDLLDGSELFFWSLIVSVLGYAASFFARGYLAGNGHFGYYAVVLLLESVARIAFALALALGIADGGDPIALGIALAPGLSLVVMPFAVRASARVSAIKKEPPGSDLIRGEAAPEFTLAEGTGFAGAILVILLSEQVFLNSGPLLVRAEDGTAQAGFIFNVLMLARAPVVLFQAAATSLLPHLTRLRSRADRSSEEQFSESVRATILVIAGFAAFTVLVVVIAGPQLMQIAFGDKFSYDRTGLVIVASGMGLYLTATTLSQATLAQAQARRAALCWAASALAICAWYLVPVFDTARRVEMGFAGGAVILCFLLWAVYRRPQPRAEDALEPGSPRETELRLSAADEAV